MLAVSPRVKKKGLATKAKPLFRRMKRYAYYCGAGVAGEDGVVGAGDDGAAGAVDKPGFGVTGAVGAV